nr:MAG TPA: hypothetical protein [Caudoviricetes sp.]
MRLYYAASVRHHLTFTVLTPLLHSNRLKEYFY